VETPAPHQGGESYPIFIQKLLLDQKLWRMKDFLATKQLKTENRFKILPTAVGMCGQNCLFRGNPVIWTFLTNQEELEAPPGTVRKGVKLPTIFLPLQRLI